MTSYHSLVPKLVATTLAVVIMLLGLNITVCVAKDGHVIAEPLAIDHHSTPLRGGAAAAMAGENPGHGPCIDAVLLSAPKETRSQLAVTVSAAQPTTAQLAVVLAQFSSLPGNTEVSHLAPRSTVLRL